MSPFSPSSDLGGEAEASGAGDVRFFEELLDAEMVVNMEKLREASRMGIPPAYRGVVYRFLLDVAFTDKSSEMTQEELQAKDFHMLRTTYSKLWGGGDEDDGVARGSGGGGAGLLSRPLQHSTLHSVAPSSGATGSVIAGPLRAVEWPPFVSRSVSSIPDGAMTSASSVWDAFCLSLGKEEPYCSDAAELAKMEAAVAALRVFYYDQSADHVQLLLMYARQLDRVMGTARDTFFATQALFQLMSHDNNPLQDAKSLQEHCGSFAMLFHAVDETLYEHFIAEGLTTWDWVPGLLSSLFVGRMHPDDVFALWDYYLADVGEHRQIMVLHPYMCLAVLSLMTEVFIEADKTELLYCLEHLPRFDTSALIHKAVAIREYVYSKGLLQSKK